MPYQMWKADDHVKIKCYLNTKAEHRTISKCGFKSSNFILSVILNFSLCILFSEYSNGHARPTVKEHIKINSKYH